MALGGVALAAYHQLQVFHLFSPTELLMLGMTFGVAAWLLVSAVVVVAKRRFRLLTAAAGGKPIDASGEAVALSTLLNLAVFLFGVWFFYGYAVPNFLNIMQVRELSAEPFVGVLPTLLAPAAALWFHAHSPRYVF